MNKVGRITPDGTITEFSIRTPTMNNIGITTGPDGALWFTPSTSNRIGRITTDGKATDILIATPNAGIDLVAAGPNGTLWFSEIFANKVGRISLALTAQPMDVDAHSVTGSSSNVNGVLEPGESVEVSPAWKNTTIASQAFSGAATALTGAAGGTTRSTTGRRLRHRRPQRHGQLPRRDGRLLPRDDLRHAARRRTGTRS